MTSPTWCRGTPRSAPTSARTHDDGITALWDIGDKMAEGAALMANTKWSSRVLGSARPSHMNRTLAETMHENIVSVGVPTWTDADVQLAKATQKELGVPEIGLSTRVAERVRGRESQPLPGELPGRSRAQLGQCDCHGHADRPRAHGRRGARPGDDRTRPADAPDVVAQAREYFDKVQAKDRKSTPLVPPQAQPAIHLNKAIMDRYRPEMRKDYYDPTKYKTYLDQLGIKYPTVRGTTTSTGQ